MKAFFRAVRAGFYSSQNIDRPKQHGKTLSWTTFSISGRVNSKRNLLYMTVQPRGCTFDYRLSVRRKETWMMASTSRYVELFAKKFDLEAPNL
jgi:hypothetical protein